MLEHGDNAYLMWHRFREHVLEDVAGPNAPEWQRAQINRDLDMVYNILTSDVALNTMSVRQVKSLVFSWILISPSVVQRVWRLLRRSRNVSKGSHACPQIWTVSYAM